MNVDMYACSECPHQPFSRRHYEAHPMTRQADIAAVSHSQTTSRTHGALIVYLQDRFARSPLRPCCAQNQRASANAASRRLVWGWLGVLTSSQSVPIGGSLPKFSGCMADNDSRYLTAPAAIRNTIEGCIANDPVDLGFRWVPSVHWLCKAQ